MAVIVDIADRQYDFTDEEKAAQAVADFQNENGLSDEAIRHCAKAPSIWKRRLSTVP